MKNLPSSRGTQISPQWIRLPLSKAEGRSSSVPRRAHERLEGKRRMQQRDANQIQCHVRPHPLVSARSTHRLMLSNWASALDSSLQEPRLLQQPGPSPYQALAPLPFYGSHQLQNQLYQHLPAAKTALNRLGLGGCSTLSQHLQGLTWNQRSRLTPADKMKISSRIIHVKRRIKPSSSTHGTPRSCGTALQSLLNKNVYFCGFAISALFSTTAEQ